MIKLLSEKIFLGLLKRTRKRLQVNVLNVSFFQSLLTFFSTTL